MRILVVVFQGEKPVAFSGPPNPRSGRWGILAARAGIGHLWRSCTRMRAGRQLAITVRGSAAVSFPGAAHGRAPTDLGPAATLQKTRRGPGHSSSVDIWAILPSAVRDIAMLKVRPANVAR